MFPATEKVQTLRYFTYCKCYTVTLLLSLCLPHPSFPCWPQGTKASAEHIARTSYTSSQKHSTKCKRHWNRRDFTVVTQRLRGKIPLWSHTKNCRSHQSTVVSSGCSHLIAVIQISDMKSLVWVLFHVFLFYYYYFFTICPFAMIEHLISWIVSVLITSIFLWLIADRRQSINCI